MNKLEQIKQYFSKGTTIIGANMETIENAHFHLLSEAKHEIEYSSQEIEILKHFEAKIISLFDHLENGLEEETHIKSMHTKDGKVILKDGQICHRCTPTMQTLKNISVGGVFASEWFGKSESEGEGRLCAFATKRFTSNSSITNSIILSSLKPSPSKCFLYFDETNPLMKELLSIDFFEYQNIKKQHQKKSQSCIQKL